MEVALIFIPAIIENEEEIKEVNLSYLTDRLGEIFQKIIEPYDIKQIVFYRPSSIVVSVDVPSFKDAEDLIETAGYYLTDQEKLKLGLTYPETMPRLGQDRWAESDLTIDDDETLMAIGYRGTSSIIEFVPILVEFHVYNISQ